MRLTTPAMIPIILLTAMSVGPALTAAGRCERVLPGPAFPREIVVPEPAADELVSTRPEPPGETRLAELDGRTFELLQILHADLDGDGERDETLLVEGIYGGFFSPELIPRVLHRVDGVPPTTTIWSQELPDGLAGQIQARDVDGDGREDLIAQVMQVGGFFFFVYPAGFQLLWSDGDGPLIAGQRSGSSPGIVDARDVTGDGLNDLIVELQFNGPQRSVYPATTARTFDEGLFYTPIDEDMFLDQPATLLHIADFDEDGLDDAVSITAAPNTEALAISRGDGTFELRPLPRPDAFTYWPFVEDLDGDGRPDLFYKQFDRGVAIHIGWGSGDATFEPFEAVELPGITFRHLRGDIDGDGRDELVFVQRAVVFFDGRVARSVPLDRSQWFYSLADIDGDGRDDQLFRSEDRLGVAWRRSRGDGTFEPLRDVVVDRRFDDRIAGVEPVDFDADGVLDLFVQLRPSPSTAWYDALLRGTGDGGFELWWRSSEPFQARRERYLFDVDADGRIDLVSFRGETDFDTGLTHPLRIFPGNGLGFDEDPMDTRWLSFAGEPGRFRREGTVDLLRIASFGSTSSGLFPYGGDVFVLELNPSLGRVHDRDMEPPIVEFRLVPGGAGEDAGLWRVATLPLDDCSGSPRVIDRRLELETLPPGSAITFRPAERTAFTVVEDRLSGARAVVIEGPERSAALAAFERARAEGVPFVHLQPMRLQVENTYGPPVPGVPGARQIQRIELFEGQVESAFATYPGADLRLRALAEDGIQTGASGASFRELLGGE